MKDVIIIGAGIAGAFIARELSKYDMDILLLDRENDVGNATTMANSAIIHAGYDAVPGTLKRKYNLAGNPMFDQVCEELDVPFKRIGSLVLAFGPEDEATLKELNERGMEHAGDAPAVPGMKILCRGEVLKMEPHISGDVTAALYAPTAGIVSPYELTIALVENAMDNGAACVLNSEVTGIRHIAEGFEIAASTGIYRSRLVFNCAGVFSDEIAKMAGGQQLQYQAETGAVLRP